MSCSCVRLEADPGIPRYTTITAVQCRPACPVHGTEAEPGRWIGVELGSMDEDEVAWLNEAEPDELQQSLRRSIPVTAAVITPDDEPPIVLPGDPTQVAPPEPLDEG